MIPETTRPPAVLAQPAVFPHGRGWPDLLVFLGVTLGLLAWFCVRLASTYCLEVPMQTATGTTARMLYLYDSVPDAHATNVVILTPGAPPVPARFELHGEEVGPVEFGPTLSPGEVVVGMPVLRSAADCWLHLDIR